MHIYHCWLDESVARWGETWYGLIWDLLSALFSVSTHQLNFRAQRGQAGRVSGWRDFVVITASHMIAASENLCSADFRSGSIVMFCLWSSVKYNLESTQCLILKFIWMFYCCICVWLPVLLDRLAFLLQRAPERSSCDRVDVQCSGAEEAHTMTKEKLISSAAVAERRRTEHVPHFQKLATLKLRRTSLHCYNFPCNCFVSMWIFGAK